MRQTMIVTTLALLALCRSAMAVPDTVSPRVTDVTTTSLSMVWMTDVPADPALEIYTDAGMTMAVSEGITLTAMPDATPATVAAAKANGVMKVRASGLSGGTRYFVRSVTRDSADPASVGYSALQEVTTATEVRPYTSIPDGPRQGYANDLSTSTVYIRPNDASDVPGLGCLLLLETGSSVYPLSAFIGNGVSAPEGVIDLNNLFGPDHISRVISGGEVSRLRFYRGGSLSTILQYRRIAPTSGTGAPAEPEKGFFADLNLDGLVDDADFEAFRAQYRTAPEDPAYNPDYKFVPSAAGKVDAQDFSRFAGEYGRADVPAR